MRLHIQAYREHLVRRCGDGCHDLKIRHEFIVGIGQWLPVTGALMWRMLSEMRIAPRVPAASDSERPSGPAVAAPATQP